MTENSDEETVTCEYVTDTEEGEGHTDAEEVSDDGIVTCTAEAQRVIRKVGAMGLQGRKRAVCENHAQYLVTDAEIEWEFDAMDPETLRSNG